MPIILGLPRPLNIAKARKSVGIYKTASGQLVELHGTVLVSKMDVASLEYAIIRRVSGLTHWLIPGEVMLPRKEVLGKNELLELTASLYASNAFRVIATRFA